MPAPVSPPFTTLSGRADLAGLWVPLITPFLPDDGQAGVDHAALASLTRRLANDGVDGFVVCGTTGEAAALTDEEKLACLDTVAQHAGHTPLLVGAGGEQWQATRGWVMRVAHKAQTDCLNVTGILLTAPHYIRPSQSGIQHWFETLADASPLPIVVYDIPYRTGATINRDTLLALAAHPNIVGVKDCGGDHGKTLAMLADGRLQILAGEDLAIFSHLSLGGAGAIAASLHLRTPEFVMLRRLIASGDLAQARQLWHQLVPLIEALFAEPNPGPLKAALAQLGCCHPDTRAPLTATSHNTWTRLTALIR